MRKNLDRIISETPVTWIRKILRKPITYFTAIALGLLSCEASPGTPITPSSNNNGNQYCQSNSGCLGGLACKNNKCVVPEKESEFASKTTGLTNAFGEVSFLSNGEQIPVAVKSEQNSPLVGITVHYLSKGDHNVLLAIDPSGNYFPERKAFQDATIYSPLTFESDNTLHTEEQSLIGEIVLFMTFAVPFAYKLYKEMAKAEPGDFLGEDEDVNKYCLTLEQMKNNYIDVPAGIVLLAAEQAGAGSEELKIAVTTPLKKIFEEYIVTKYGEQQGYEVWVPKTAITLCGQAYSGTICNLNDTQLYQIWSTDVPYWKINGICTPSGQSCIPNAKKECEENSVVSYDSCGKKGSVIEVCDFSCENGSCISESQPCQDECDYGETICQGSTVMTCATSNDCTKWVPAVSCGGGQVCKNGECVEEGTECISHDYQDCGGNTTVNWFDSCGNLEEVVKNCTGDEYCSNGQCVSEPPTCEDECDTFGEHVCTSNNSIKSCDYHDSDPCLEWGYFDCYPETLVCIDGYCKEPDNAIQFKDLGDGTILDEQTGNIWEKTSPEKKDWYQAKNYCEELSLANSDSWTLPLFDELFSLHLTQKIQDCYIDPIFIGPCSGYWTSDKDNSSVDPSHYVVYFQISNGDGGKADNTFSASNNNPNYVVRCLKE